MRSEIIAMKAPIARIVGRYLSGAMMVHAGWSLHEAQGVFWSVEMLTMLEFIVGAALGIGVEFFYALAVKRGWTK